VSTGPWSFKHADIARAAKALAKAGYTESRVVIDPVTRKIEVVGVKSQQPAADTAENEWDEALK
jgi:hypothetical protein